jgi:hypothetical protein
VRLSELDETSRELWLADMARVDQELDAAQVLLVDAVRRRPGWPGHQTMLGIVEYSRARDANEVRESPTWFHLLQGAMRAAPGDRFIPTYTAFALAESWNEVKPEMRTDARRIFGTAMHDSQFVASNYLAVTEAVGKQAAAALLPDSAPSLHAAMRAVGDSGDASAAAQLHGRWERAEWRARQTDLRAIEERTRFGDYVGADQACTRWIDRHSEYDFDHPAGRQQVARLLALWPEKPGVWRTDRRASLVQYFMSGRMASINPGVLSRVLGALEDVPPVIAARAALAAGDIYGAESMVRSSETAGAFEWTPFYVDYARLRLREGDPAGAAAAIDRISPSARDECDVALARRAVAEAMGEDLDLPPELIPRTYPAEYWSRAGVPLCIDGENGFRNLVVSLNVPEKPALVSFGFDGGRSTTTLVPRGQVRVSVPLAGRSGRHFFSYRLIAGQEINPSAAVLQ